MAKLTQAQVEQLLLRNGASASEAKTLAAISMGESGGDTTVPGDKKLQNATWGPSIGLFQVRTLKGQKGSGSARDEVALLGSIDHQAKAALQIARTKQGYKHWTQYTNGGYKKYLAQGGATPAAQGRSGQGSTQKAATPLPGYSAGVGPLDTSVVLPGAPGQVAYPGKPSYDLSAYGGALPPPSTNLDSYGRAPTLPAAWDPYTPDPVARTRELSSAFPLPLAEVEAIQKRILAESQALALQQQAEYGRQAELERSRVGASQQFVNQGLAGIGDMTAAATLANQAGSASAASAAIAQLAQASQAGMGSYFPGGAQGAANSIGQILQANIGQGLLSQMGQSQLDQASRQYQTNQQFGLTEAEARYGRADTDLNNAQQMDLNNTTQTNQSRKDYFGGQMDQYGELSADRRAGMQGALNVYGEQAADRRSRLAAATDTYSTGSSNTRQINQDNLAVWGAQVDAAYKDVANRLDAQSNDLRAQELALTAQGRTDEAKMTVDERKRADAARLWLQNTRSMVGMTDKPDGSIDTVSIGSNYDPNAGGAAGYFYGSDGAWAGYDWAKAAKDQSHAIISDKAAGDLMVGMAIANRVEGKAMSLNSIREVAEVRVLSKYQDTPVEKTTNGDVPVIGSDGRVNPYSKLRGKIDKEIEAEYERLHGIYETLTVAPNQEADDYLVGMLTVANENKRQVATATGIMDQAGSTVRSRLGKQDKKPRSNAAGVGAVGKASTRIGPLAPAFKAAEGAGWLADKAVELVR